MEARLIIAKLRDGGALTRDECVWFADGLADGTVTDAQAGAFAMAVFLNGVGGEGRVALTQAMRDSGDVLEWDLPGPVLDKHSTGGIGDSVSLLLAPALAACETDRGCRRCRCPGHVRSRRPSWQPAVHHGQELEK